MEDNGRNDEVLAGEVITFEGAVVLKNEMKSSVTPPPAGYRSWLDYWKERTGKEECECAHEVCHRPATEGSIAFRAFSSDKSRYLFPACETCARRTEMLYVSSPLVKLT